VSQGRNLGTLPISYPLSEGSFLIFAGQRWRIVSVDAQHKVVDLLPSPGGRPPIFGGTGALVHDRVRQEMFNVYRSGNLPPYLDETARDLLVEARANFARLGLGEEWTVEVGKDALLFCWMGDRVLNTITLQLRAHGLRVSHEDLGIVVESCRRSELLDALRLCVAEGPWDVGRLAAGILDKLSEKHDRFLPERLLTADYGTRLLEPANGWRVLKAIVGKLEGQVWLSQ
jgi:ATP-dependent Lhr-like helicase